ncbi:MULTISPECIES: phenylacetic acid degradation protein PaaN [Roseobacteraceae]|uniref:Phenylacetic acid degradation protein PaaN n=1 Tax=Celeribacter baekdonensis TaxID=875171 RepID=A0A2R4M911_9RHOB|nr:MULTISPECIES: phenylacetic acid degradation protein PaaN [Roseobacteraceae]AVW93690.1 phenylacetic acid degradation protein PaaN [Celeribacter baekdonensis]KAB6714596.1 phenylacetic acid degradation protein PaaN [Roseobacter sp. TSBP12]
MQNMFDRHSGLLEDALRALETREFWTPFPEIPSGKIYGNSARAEADAAFEALIGQAFEIPGHPETARVGAEMSPWGKDMAMSYPTTDAAAFVMASQAVTEAFAEAGPEVRVGALLEALVRLNKMSFLLGHATMHTTGQAFAMAFQAGGPHAQDRGLEALAMAWSEMTRSATQATWTKPQGKHAPIVIEKQWHLMPRGVSLTIGCNTFPTWNSYPGIFASLATGNPVIIKPHPRAILPLALTVRVLREVFAEAGLPQDAVLLASDAPGAEITKTLVSHPDVKIIDYTGSSGFADWIRANAGPAQVFTEETGVNSVTITGTDDFKGMCANLAFSLSLYSGQMCTSPQNIYIPEGGIGTDEEPKRFDDVVAGIASAIDALLDDPDRAAGVCGTIINSATFERIGQARAAGQVIRESGETGQGQSATPLMIVVDGIQGPQDEECFGPVSFIIPCADAAEAISRAADVAKRKGAITAALYAQDDALIDAAAKAFAKAGVNLSVNLTGNIYVNQSAAFSDFHVTGANPAGNASLTDAAFVAPRFRRVMIRRPKAA